MTVLLRVARNVSSLSRAQAFYSVALDFEVWGNVVEDAELAVILGISNARTLRMRRGAQQIELTECFSAGAAYPASAGADDIGFQHIALVTDDMEAAFTRAMRAGATPISIGGPQRLPASSGGVTAWKFRDPDGHPLEFLQFPSDHPPQSGYDHSAISVADIDRSIAFYGAIGLQLHKRQLNQGIEQDRLDGLSNVYVEVAAMASSSAPPHVELLAYRDSRHRPRLETQANDIAADRLVFSNTAGGLSLSRDPDGYFLSLDGR